VAVTVLCEPGDEDHGPAGRDHPRLAWRCATCGREVTDEEVYRLTRGRGSLSLAGPVVMT
jgi:hypothetical protein